MNKKEKYNICFVLSGLAGGGIESLVTTLSNYYVSHGHIVTLLLLYKDKEHFFKPDKRVTIIEPVLDRAKINKYIYAARLIPFIRKQIKRINPDVIVSHGEWQNAYVVLAHIGLKYPLYLEDHMNPDLNLGFLPNTAKKFLYKHATGIIALTDYAAKVTKAKTGSVNVAVIPNPINIKESIASHKSNTIVTVGRLSKEKGHQYLLEAFAGLNRKDWNLEIVGDGIERKNLEELAAKLGIKDRVLFHGYKSDFEQILNKSEIFVLPSLSECFPLALTEAMAIPLACISSDCLAGNDVIIINGVNGILVKPGNSSELATAIGILMDNKVLRNKLSIEAYKIRDMLNIDRIALNYLNFITHEYL